MGIVVSALLTKTHLKDGRSLKNFHSTVGEIFSEICPL